jgi:hypothetical protein
VTQCVSLVENNTGKSLIKSVAEWRSIALKSPVTFDVVL